VVGRVERVVKEREVRGVGEVVVWVGRWLEEVARISGSQSQTGWPLLTVKAGGKRTH
jgi:hypothetical protein